MSNYRKIITKVLIIILGLILIISGSGVILLSLPITSSIANLARDNHIIYAFLWLMLLLFIWAIGVFMFVMGIFVYKIYEDEDNNTHDDEMIE